MTFGKLARGTGSYILGVFLCLTIPTAIFLTGWIYRLAQVQALSTWRRLAKKEGFELDHKQVSRLPSWSFKKNIKTGFFAVVNAFAITLLPGVIMYFSWYAGWDNSFNKGYEQFSVGALTGFLGVFLLALAMLYLPMAQARQAVSGSGRAFWDLRRVRRAAFASPVSSFLLALGYLIGGFALMLPPVLIIFVNAGWDGLQAKTPEEIKGILNLYYLFWCAAVIFPGFLVLKIAGARIYARTTYHSYRGGHLDLDELTPMEQDWLAKLPQEQLPKKVVARSFIRIPARILIYLLWVAFVFQIYVTQFFVYEGGTRWLRHPLVQLPWFRPIPAHLEATSE